MDQVIIQKLENGYTVESVSQYEVPQKYVAATDKEMIDLVTEFFFGGVLDIAKVPSPEQPKDTSNEDTTETMVEASDDIVPASLPVTPMADLSATQRDKDDVPTDAYGCWNDYAADIMRGKFKISESKGSAETE